MRGRRMAPSLNLPQVGQAGHHRQSGLHIMSHNVAGGSLVISELKQI